MFDLNIEAQLVPKLRPVVVVILDNLSSHNRPDVAAALCGFAAWTLVPAALRP